MRIGRKKDVRGYSVAVLFLLQEAMVVTIPHVHMQASCMHAPIHTQ